MVATAISVLTWASCITAFHYTEYRVVFVGAVQDAFNETRAVDGGPPLSGDEAITQSDEILEKETGHAGFRGFLTYRGRSGLEMRVLQKKVEHPAWSIGVWILDLLVLLFVMLRIGLGVVRRSQNTTNTVEARQQDTV